MYIKTQAHSLNYLFERREREREWESERERESDMVVVSSKLCTDLQTPPESQGNLDTGTIFSVFRDQVP